MLSKIVKPGDKIEIRRFYQNEQLVEDSKNNEIFIENTKIKTYFSKIYDIIGEDKIKIAIPIVGSQLVLLNLQEKYEIFIFTSGGLYRCCARVTKRYKEGTSYVAVLNLLTGLQKFQRREYYRLERNMDISYKILEEQEVRKLIDPQTPLEYWGKIEAGTWIKAMTMDISGGGIRFVSPKYHENVSYMLVRFTIKVNNLPKQCTFISKVVRYKTMEHKANSYEYRLQFINVPKQEREHLIKFIFAEEINYRKKRKGLIE